MKVIAYAVWLNLAHFDYGVLLLSRKLKISFREAEDKLNELLTRIELAERFGNFENDL